MEYRYEAYTADKKIVRGTLDASSEAIAEGLLYGAGYPRVLQLKEIRKTLALERLFPSLFSIKEREVIEFSYQLATLLESGMPIITALNLITKQKHKTAMKETISGIRIELEGGSSFDKALNKYPHVFPEVYRQIIKASEHTGNLVAALRQAAGYLEKNREKMARITRALAYPLLVTLMAIAVVTIIINVAFPPLTRLFISLGSELPWTTRSLIAIAGIFTDYKLYLLGGLFTFFVLLVGLVQLPGGRVVIDRLILKIPRIGHIVLLRDMNQLCRTMSLLLEAGVPLPKIMTSVIGTVSNRVIRNALIEVRQRLIQGQGLSQPMAQLGIFPELLVEMAVIGEKSGSLPSVLASLSDLYEKNIEQEVHLLISVVQNSLMILIAVAVGYIGISMITPLYSMLQTVH
ncbi:MAG: hypothetical protein A2W25_05435 [candidate division Zixibacteria bacterium RBG_16_53_22]|nr:MAG: hypothetical protein A2W25_05435 [candidate division Zixibacteria bacterium RBG_16_53_22]